jgi:hypothetical protein
MANAPEKILLLWQRVEALKVVVPPEVWDLWKPYVQDLNEIAALVKKSAPGPVSAANALMIVDKSARLQRFIRALKASTDGKSTVDGTAVLLHPDVLELVTHYIGNDLYVILLVADVPKENPQPLPAAEALHIVERVKTIKEFLTRIRQQTTHLAVEGAG